MAEPAIPPLHVIEHALADLKRWGRLVNHLGSQEPELPAEVLYVVGAAIERTAGEALSAYEVALESGGVRGGQHG